MLVALQVADLGFYSDDWAIQWYWDNLGYGGTVDIQFDILGSKPLLAVALPAPYELFGSDPAWHHALAAALVLASTVAFYFVLRGLRFAARDAVPIALLALLFPWATGVRLWPTGSINNLAVLLLFGGFLVALWGLRTGGRRGLAVHVVAAALYAASVLTYETTTLVACMLWPAYAWLHGWRPALPRAAMDVAAVGAAALYSTANTNKHVVDLSKQISHVPDILRDGADLVAASLVPAFLPADYPAALTAVVLIAALAALAAIVIRRRGGANADGPGSGLHWVAVAGVALAALALCWGTYVPQAFYTPTFRGIEDRVNVLALYPVVVLVYAVLRSAGYLVSRNSYAVAVAGSIAIVIGYGVHDVRQQREWARAADLQEPVLAAIERASPPDGALVLTFGHAADVAPRIPVFNVTYDLYPAAQLRTDSSIETYPVFEGAELRCSPRGVTVRHLPTPLYETISLKDWGTPGTTPYGHVVFVDVAGGRHAVIRSTEQCTEALRTFPPGPWDQ